MFIYGDFSIEEIQDFLEIHKKSFYEGLHEEELLPEENIPEIEKILLESIEGSKMDKYITKFLDFWGLGENPFGEI